MKSQSIVEYGKPLQELSRETPKPTGSQVLLKVTHCGVCHSDVHIQDGQFDMGGGRTASLTAGLKLPFIMGHEIEGEVVALGPNAKGAAIGDHRVVYPWTGCGECSFCKSGEEFLCDKPSHLGVHIDGGYADHVIVPHSRYLLDYTGIPDGLAATYMCSGMTAFGALKKFGELGSDDKVMIVGLGGLGMMALQFARAMFAQPPIVADIDDSKLQAATKNGAGATYNSKDPGAAKQLMADTGGGVAAVVDFVGSEASVKFATRSLRKGGKLVIVGLFGGGLSMPIPLFPLRAISIMGSAVASLEQTHEMLDLVKSGKVAPIPVEERPLSQANKTLDDLRGGKIVGRVVLKP